MAGADIPTKIRAEHLERNAYVYVRQSSAYQVEHHLESQRRQYGLAKWAGELGWPGERIVVVDEDQGRSGSSAGTRPGFERLAGAVGSGQVGIVLSLEASRLARNSPDWHHLIYLCRWTNTLIGDEHGIYDPGDSNDRMVLGIRGQMSEMELDTSIHRMVEGRWSKARRGEFLTIPPAGYEIDELGQLVMTSDEAVQSAIRTVFDRFEEMGTARQVFVRYREGNMKFPVRRLRPHAQPVVWVQPRYRMIMAVLHNPIYAGAYVFGRTRTQHEVDPDDPRRLKVRKRRVKLDEPAILIKDHHPGYISYEKLMEIQERIRNNSIMGDGRKRGVAREGEALLQGLARCGHCGRPMLVNYGGKRHSTRCKRTLQYRCGASRREEGLGDCQLVGGKQIDRVVVDAFLEATAPAGLEAALAADEQLRRQSQELERYWSLQVEKARYEAQRAERQYDAVEPENRTVARELERRWNEHLEELKAVSERAQAAIGRQRPLTSSEITRARQLGKDLEAVWGARTTTNRDRKRLLRSVIEEVQIRSQEHHYEVKIVWKGGIATDHSVVRRRVGERREASEQMVELVRTLSGEFDDAQIARILNKQGWRLSGGKPYSKLAVGKLRREHGIAACKPSRARDPIEGPFTADEAAAELGVRPCTIHRWLREGVLAGSQKTPGAPWRIVLTEKVRARLRGGDAPAGWVGLTEAARRLGMDKSSVAYLVNSGKLPGVRTKVGKRTVWRIDVSSGRFRKQRSLFDQKSTDDSREA